MILFSYRWSIFKHNYACFDWFGYIDRWIPSGGFVRVYQPFDEVVTRGKRVV